MAAILILRMNVVEPGPLYLIPVLMAGYWFGRWGGVSVAVACAFLYAVGRVVGPAEMDDLSILAATLARLVVYGAAGAFVGWLAESRVGLERTVRQRDHTLTELRTIQETLSPPKPEPRPGLQLATCYLPAEDGVAGDFYLITQGLNDSTVIAIGDVAGRGLEAAQRDAAEDHDPLAVAPEEVAGRVASHASRRYLNPGAGLEPTAIALQ